MGKSDAGMDPVPKRWVVREKEQTKKIAGYWYPLCLGLGRSKKLSLSRKSGPYSFPTSRDWEHQRGAKSAGNGKLVSVIRSRFDARRSQKKYICRGIYKENHEARVLCLKMHSNSTIRVTSNISWNTATWRNISLYRVNTT